MPLPIASIVCPVPRCQPLGVGSLRRGDRKKGYMKVYQNPHATNCTVHNTAKANIPSSLLGSLAVNRMAAAPRPEPMVIVGMAGGMLKYNERMETEQMGFLQTNVEELFTDLSIRTRRYPVSYTADTSARPH